MKYTEKVHANPQLISRCSCGKFLGLKPCAPENDGKVSHGLCDDCYERAMVEIEEVEP